MSNAFKLTLLDKWTDVATPPTSGEALIPSISPTSPKATKLCCCSNRRRYNLKQSKKTALHGRNILISEHLSHIDDATDKQYYKHAEIPLPATALRSPQIQSEGTINKRLSAADDDDRITTTVVIARGTANALLQKGSNTDNVKNYHNDDNICNGEHELGLSEVDGGIVEKPYGKGCAHTKYKSKISTDTGYNLPTPQQHRENHQQQKHCSNTVRESREEEQDAGEDQKIIQRFIYSEFEHNNKENTIFSNSNPTKLPTTTYVDKREKMTITTTTANMAQSKRSECGLVLTTTAPISAPTTSSLVATRATPSLTTVIKTVAVKITPLKEATPSSSPSIATTPTPNTMLNGVGHNERKNLDDYSLYSAGNVPDTRTVKEKVAALTAANEQTKNHDNSLKLKMFSGNQSNCNQMAIDAVTKTVVHPKSVMTGSQQNQSAIEGSNCSTKTNEPANNNTTALLNSHTGHATMPRRRNFLLSAASKALPNNEQAMAVNAEPHQIISGALKKASSPSHFQQSINGDVSRELAALDNLDLPFNLNHPEDDPYFALQEYLERVKLEINEVFELHKARQKLQQLQSEVKPETSTTISNDELSQSPQSDSGFASGVYNNASNASSNGIAAPQELVATSTSCLDTRNIAPETTTTHSRLTENNHSADVNRYIPPTACDRDSLTNVQLDATVPGSNNGTASTVVVYSEKFKAPPMTTELKALAPPPVSPEVQETMNEDKPAATAAATTVVATDGANIWTNIFLRDFDTLMTSDKSSSTPAINTWASAVSSPSAASAPIPLTAAATAAIKSRRDKTAPMDREQSQQATLLKPEKHTTIPLQSFNFDSKRLDTSSMAEVGTPPAAAVTTTRSNIAYMRALSAPNTTNPQHQPQQQSHNINKFGSCVTSGCNSNRNRLTTFNFAAATASATVGKSIDTKHSTKTILKIEEAATSGQPAKASAMSTNVQGGCIEESLKAARQQQEATALSLGTGNNTTAATKKHFGNSDSRSSKHDDGDKSMLVAFAMATSLPKRERINHATVNAAASTTPTAQTLAMTMTPVIAKRQNTVSGGATTSATNMLNGSEFTKKGSTSTIWTSEESILRSVGAVDEDNNSTSSSVCEEASAVLSSSKSGVSLDSSSLDNYNNESGIGTATPPKDLCFWKNAHNDNESLGSFDTLRKIKFQKAGSVASSDDPDLLEVLSLYDEQHGDEDIGEDDPLDGIAEEAHQQQQLKKQRCQHHQKAQVKRSRAVSSDEAHLSRLSRRPPVDGSEGQGLTAVLDADEDDEGHDEFEMISYCECECTDGDASSITSGSGISRNTNRAGSSASLPSTSVVLRRKCVATTPIMVPYNNSGGVIIRAQKSRSHSLDTSSPYLNNAHPPLARKLHQHHLHANHNRSKDHSQLSLALRQEPFQSLLVQTHFPELPSPSSASLHSGHESLGMQELTTKSNSAPLLLKQERKRDDFAGQKLTLRYSRSQSDRYLAEIEAVEACKWLRAAGFPQYAQMYEDHQFPIDLTNVAKDHTNLENDQLQSLYRRLCILNRCANMRLDQSHKPQTPQKEDSDDENFALSENWTFQPHIRRWSRIGEMGLELPPNGQLNLEKTESSSKESSPDRFEDDSYDETGAVLSLTLPNNPGELSAAHELSDSGAVRLRRTGSERLKDGAKAFLRRVESIKSRRRKRQNREGIVISGPQALDLSQLGQRHSLRKPDAVYSTPPSPSAVSPMHTFPKPPLFGNELTVPSHSDSFLNPNRSSPRRTPTTPRSMRTSPLHFFSSPMPHLKEGKSDDSSSYYSDSQESSAGGKLSLRKTPSKTKRFLQRTGKVDDIGAHSDSECHQGRKLLIKDANANTTEVKVKKLSRGGSLNLGKDSKKREGGFRSASFRSRSTTRKETKTDEADIVKKTPVMRWHSFQMEERAQMIFRKCFTQRIEQANGDEGIAFAAMSAGQLQIIRKLALVILTGHMERYCPSHRSGWNWELPKFIKKIKMPDYKDKRLFGVPLLLILQRTGLTLPYAVRAAFRWLQLNALDQIGIFRKSGVKSRILRLREEIECTENIAECMDVFDKQQAYDVADMLKQYFRDLPESLLTTKMSETFVAIFQHLPPEVRLEAIQCAVLLLPDENREILYALLEFLRLVADNAKYNQMTPNNLAVCLAPSLFHSSISTGAASVSASPRRRNKNAGVPDAKELTEAKASHECLAFMIENYMHIFTATKEKVSKCNFGYMEESKPVSLESLGEDMRVHNWRGYLFECTSATIKEGREKTRGWFSITSLGDPNVDIAYKKVGDGHPLRLWRCITEVDGPPKNVLDYIVKQRASWDPNLLQCQTVKQLDERTEIFQYAIDGQTTIDFCVVRSWQMDLPRGACVIVETSVDHIKAKPIYGAVRGVVLASRYLIEPCGGGRSRIMHLSRVDIKGKTPEWYNKSYGHICSHHLTRIRLAFKTVVDGPESKV